MTGNRSEMVERQAVLDALHERLEYPTEACAIVRSLPTAAPSQPLSDDVVERVARALCEDSGEDPDDLDACRICDKDNQPLPLWTAFEEAARAAIAAIPSAGGLETEESLGALSERGKDRGGAGAAMTKPSLMRFEGAPYDDGSGPKITVEYREHMFSDHDEAGVSIKTFGSDVVVFATEIDWLIETLQRIQKERSHDRQ